MPQTPEVKLNHQQYTNILRAMVDLTRAINQHTVRMDQLVTRLDERRDDGTT